MQIGKGHQLVEATSYPRRRDLTCVVCTAMFGMLVQACPGRPITHEEMMRTVRSKRTDADVFGEPPLEELFG